MIAVSHFKDILLPKFSRKHNIPVKTIRLLITCFHACKDTETFSKSDINILVAAKKRSDINSQVNLIEEQGYIEKVREAQYWFSGVNQCNPALYSFTTKGKLFIEKYCETIRRYMRGQNWD